MPPVKRPKRVERAINAIYWRCQPELEASCSARYIADVMRRNMQKRQAEVTNCTKNLKLFSPTTPPTLDTC